MLNEWGKLVFWPTKRPLEEDNRQRLLQTWRWQYMLVGIIKQEKNIPEEGRGHFISTLWVLYYTLTSDLKP